ncbi:hypothetical protein [Kitasatospora aureofaciens]|uniref:hypothetical protein n=1 Tax=Kitasatospora aureofaciens TaxID=1894 RepID=UPI001C48DA3B|nr:hypothetical protein [Kitasatospora aureofaciens]MBV6703507.1 hypothetical protein [Kitasatospora aureofaciens]
MGTSPSIETLQAKDDQFRQYLQTLEQDLTQKASAAKEKMHAEIETFYSHNKYDDAKVFVSGENIDFLHEKEFTLDNLKKVIDGIGAAVFSGAAPPKGSTVTAKNVEDADKALGKEIGAMANLELYIAGKVFDVVSNTVLSFGTGTSMTYTTATKTESLGFGLQMFASTSASSYDGQSFFKNEYISQYLYMYEVRFSVKQAQSEAAMGLVQAYENQLAVFEEMLNKLGDQLADGTVSWDAYGTTSEKLQIYMDEFQRKIGALKSVDRAAQVRAALDRAQARAA